MGISELLAAGAITILNGAWTAVTAVVHPITLAVLVLGASFAWLALLEADELDRQGTKPEIARGL